MPCQMPRLDNPEYNWGLGIVRSTITRTRSITIPFIHFQVDDFLGSDSATLRFGGAEVTEDLENHSGTNHKAPAFEL